MTAPVDSVDSAAEHLPVSRGLAAYLMAPAIAQEPLLYEASSNGERMASTSSATGLCYSTLVIRASQLGADWEWVDSSRCQWPVPLASRHCYLQSRESRELLTTSSQDLPRYSLDSPGLRTSWTRRLLLLQAPASLCICR